MALWKACNVSHCIVKLKRKYQIALCDSNYTQTFYISQEKNGNTEKD